MLRYYLSGIKGWVKLYRSVLNNPVVMKSEHHFCVWIILILLAAGKSRKALFNGKEITLRPGEIVTGRDEIAGMLKGLNSSAVERALTDFKNEQQIEQQTSNHGRLIYLKKWNEYQAKITDVKPNSNIFLTAYEQQPNNKRTTREQQLNTNKEREKDKKDKNEREPPLSFGRYNNVFLSSSEVNRLMSDYPYHYLKKIDRLSAYLLSTGKKYQNHYAVLVEWLEADAEKEVEHIPAPTRRASYDIEELEKII